MLLSDSDRAKISLSSEPQILGDLGIFFVTQHLPIHLELSYEIDLSVSD